MTSRYENEIILEDPGSPPPGRRYSIGGIVVGGLLAVALVVGVVAFGRAAADWLADLSLGADDETAANVEPGLDRTINVPPGSSARDIGSLLVDAGVIGSSSEFETAVRTRAVAAELQAGDYELQTGMETNEALDVLLEGPLGETYRLTLREGLRIEEVLAELATQTDYTADEFRAVLESGQVTSSYLPAEVEGITAWEGLLFPDTYEFFNDAAPVEILDRLAGQLERNMDGLDLRALEERGLTPYDAIIMASIIEGEVQLDGERPLVASVLYNRLEQGIPLQIDATVLYALGERRTGLTLADLEVDSPYNTYQVQGLPPTPIGGPRLASLLAVTRPAETDYLYYVLTATDGTHSFTADYNEFLEYKAQAQADGILP